jgi:hypothetical protein
MYLNLMFCVRFVFLVFCRLLKENDRFKVKNAKFGRKHTLRKHVEMDELAPLDPYASAAEHWTLSQYAFQKLLQA